MQRRHFIGGVGAVSIAGLAGTAYVLAPRMPDVMYVQTELDAVARMLKLAEVTSKDIIYDLGCGDGRFVVMAARQFGARGVGIDIDAERIKEARDLAQRADVAGRVRFIKEDLFSTDISGATVVTLYLAPQLNLRLRPKLIKELKPGARIVSYAFDMGDWKPEKSETAGSTPIYLWRIPPRG